MEACRQFNRDVRVIYTGTRGQYGEATSLPVDESAPTMPKVLQEISNLTAEKITHMYHQVHCIRSVMLRLTNIYGERGQMRHSRYGVANWFIRQAIDDEEIKVFGTGEIKRDFLYIDDCIDALLMCALREGAYGEIFNVATGDPLDFVTLAKTLVEVAQTGRWTFAPFSPERAAQEPGDFYADIGKIERMIGWQPITSLHDGLAKAIGYYRLNKEHYW
jgi:UDP-glucose 4-epimerase